MCVLRFCIELPQNTHPSSLPGRGRSVPPGEGGRALAGGDSRGIPGVCWGLQAAPGVSLCPKGEGSGCQSFLANCRPQCAPPSPRGLVKQIRGLFRHCAGQQLGRCKFIEGAMGLIPGGELRSHMPRGAAKGVRGKADSASAVLMPT